MLSNDTEVSILDAQSDLGDIRLRILNRERPTVAEMRALLLNLTRARDGAARAAKAATAAKAKENRKAAPKVTHKLTDLFPQVKG